MSKILKNNSGANITLSDLGSLTINDGTQYVIDPIDYLRFARSSDVVSEIGLGSGGLVVNDGSSDLSISDGTDLIKGIFPKEQIIVDEGGEAATVTNNALDVNASVNFPDELIDIFQRLKTSQAQVRFDYSFVEKDCNTVMAEKTVGGATITRDTNKKELNLNVSSSGDKAIKQSRQYIHYVPGYAFEVLQTGRFFAQTANLRQRIGYFDDDNGLFFEDDGSNYKVVIRSKTSGSAVDTAVNQSAWNGDKLDGTGASGVTIDFTKQQIFYIQFAWLGTGPVQFGIWSNGNFITCHTFNNENVNESSYMQTASLPIRSEIEATGSITGTKTFYWTCLAALTEGEFEFVTQQHAVDTDGTRSISSGAYRPVIAIRLKSGNVRSQLIPKGLAKALISDEDETIWRAYYNPTVTGGSWVSAGDDSIAEYNITATSISGGKQITTSFLASGEVEESGGSEGILEDSFVRVSSDVDGNPDTFVLCVRSLSGSATVYGGIIFKELF